MKKIKILVDGHVLDGKHQGTSSYISGLYSEVSRCEDCEVFVATEKEESVSKYFDGTTNVKWQPLATKNKYQRLAYGFNEVTKKIKPDYSHFQYITPLIKRNRWINTVHDLLFLDFPEFFPFSYRFKNSCLFNISAKRSDILLTVSEYSKQRISLHFNVDAQNIIVTPNAIDDISCVAPKAIKALEKCKFYVYISRFEPRKNQHLLVNAFLSLNTAKDIKLVLVGAPALPYAELDSILERNHRQVMHLQGIEKSELVWLYQNAIASLYPSKGEGFGIPPLEAVALGCPSYSADNTALSELKPFLSGTFDNDLSSITTLLGQLMLGHERTCLTEKRDQVLAKFSWAKSADILLKQLAARA